ncbi:GNAT family N-acetyltransferase [Streptomyces sp. NPDC000594]|uniref:GNAT family N-acetyltransferase n=1 Tax=Streptomyces sp. NPDC000594 TaxID=3154261 RepID=UPI003328521A
MDVRATSFDHPDAQLLNDRVQQEYQERYGDGGDGSVVLTADFVPPNGLFLMVYDADGRPVATGAWRVQDHNEEGYGDGDAELKRMYVIPEARGQGHARRLLALLEEDARAAGRVRMVLETGDQQPEAIALYASCGYVPAQAKFGHYREYDASRCLVKPLV